MKKLVFAVSLALAGCGGGLKIIKQAPASELVGKTTLSTASADYTKGDIDGHSEQEYVASQDDNGKHQWKDIKTGIDEEFNKALASGGGLTVEHGATKGALLVKPIIRFINPGSFLSASELRMAVQVATADGNVLDEIELSSRTSGSVYKATDERRLRQDAQNIGEKVAKYLLARTKAQ